MAGREARREDPSQGHEEQAAKPQPGAGAPVAGTPEQILALQRSAGNAAVSRLMRKPAAPRGLTQDRSQVAIKPAAGATLPMAFSNVSDESVDWNERRFSYTSAPTNLTATWRIFDGSDTEVRTFWDFPRDYVLDPDWVRDRVRSEGRPALGTWTVRLEKDDYYDDVEVPVVENDSPGAIEGVTNVSWYTLRDLPAKSATPLGTLSGDQVPISVDGKAKADDITWYRITLQANSGSGAGQLRAGTTGWITSDAITPIMSWSRFKTQLHAWEAAHSTLSLDQRITRLRQMSHRSDLPFDKVIGTGSAPSGTYVDDREFKPGEWDFLGDAQQIRMNDGNVVDMQHLLVGLDVLHRKKASHSIREWTLKLDVGQNWSAATWAGDIGAGAADAALKQASEWERKNAGASKTDRARFYYESRAPQADLLGNIDAWALDEVARGPSAPSSVEELLMLMYEPMVGPPAPGAATPPQPTRKRAVERFIGSYGLKVGGGAPPLRNQLKPKFAMLDQVVKFGLIWLYKRQSWGPLSTSDTEIHDMVSYSLEMMNLFLDWLDGLAASEGAVV